MIRITTGDLEDPRVLDFLNAHLTTARAETARGSAHALDAAGLRSPDVEFLSIWDDEELLGIGALKRLSPDHGEVKSMHTSRSVRRQGVNVASHPCRRPGQGLLAPEPGDRLVGAAPGVRYRQAVIPGSQFAPRRRACRLKAADFLAF